MKTLQCVTCGKTTDRVRPGQKYCVACRPDNRKRSAWWNPAPERRKVRVGDTTKRDRLAVENLAVAHGVAADVYRQVKGRVDYDDLLSGAFLGLLSAADKFDPARGVKFSTYAGSRCKGAAIDEVRRMHPHTRTMQTAKRDVEKIEQRFYAEHGRKPDEEELRAALGCDDAAFVSLKASAAVADSEPICNQDGVSHESASGPVERADWWAEAVRGLGREEKTMVLLHYRDGLSMRQVGRAIGITESRVSQLLPKVLARLRLSPRLRRMLAVENGQETGNAA